MSLRDVLATPPSAPTPAPQLRPSGDADFTDLVRQALDELPDSVLDTLANTAVLVAEGGDAAGAYGLYHGVGVAHPDVPSQIVLYQDTLARDFGHDPRLLREQVKRTVLHELAHHMGYDEPGVAALGL